MVAISVALSLAADIAFDYYILKNCRNSDKSKNNANKQEVLKEIRNKISALEKKIDSLSQKNHSYADGVDKLKKELEILKLHLNNENRTTVKSNKENEDMINILRDMSRRIAKLEKNSHYDDTTQSYDTDNLKNQIIQLDQKIESLKQLMNKPNQFAQQNGQLQQMVYQLNQEVNQLKSIVDSQQKVIREQEKTNRFSETKPVSQPSTPSVSQTTSQTSNIPDSKLPSTLLAKVIIPNQNYVRTLLSNLLSIQNCLGSVEYEHCQKKLQDILENGDFEDYEEIMSAVHEIIRKYIYESNTKVSAEEWKQLEKYIENAGYVAVPVKAGDIITPYRTYFERPIPASGGIVNTIKKIQLKPFVLFYEDSGEKEMVKLCGKCTYYK